MLNRTRAMASKLPLLLLLIAITCLSQFLPRLQQRDRAGAVARPRPLGTTARLVSAPSSSSCSPCRSRRHVVRPLRRRGARWRRFRSSPWRERLWMPRRPRVDLIAARAMVGVGLRRLLHVRRVPVLHAGFRQPSSRPAQLGVWPPPNLGTPGRRHGARWIAATWAGATAGVSPPPPWVVAVAFYAFVRDRRTTSRRASARRENGSAKS